MPTGRRAPARSRRQALLAGHVVTLAALAAGCGDIPSMGVVVTNTTDATYTINLSDGILHGYGVELGPDDAFAVPPGIVRSRAPWMVLDVDLVGSLDTGELVVYDASCDVVATWDRLGPRDYEIQIEPSGVRLASTDRILGSDPVLPVVEACE